MLENSLPGLLNLSPTVLGTLKWRCKYLKTYPCLKMEGMAYLAGSFKTAWCLFKGPSMLENGARPTLLGALNWLGAI